MRVIYRSRKGGKPLNMGMNAAKRLARRTDQNDQKIVQASLGNSLPRQRENHKALVKQRHAYYGDSYDESQRLRSQASLASSAGTGDQESGAADRAVSEPAAGADII